MRMAAGFGIVALAVGAVAWAQAPRALDASSKGGRAAALDRRQRVVQALDRFTWGIEPGQVTAVEKMGLRRWLDLQLHPSRIPENPALTAALAGLDTLQLTPGQLLSQYPPFQLVQQMAMGKRPLPLDPKLRAVVEREIAAYRRNSEAQPAEGAPAAAHRSPGARAPELFLTDDAAEADAAPLGQLLDPAQIAAIETGPPRRRVAALDALPDPVRDQVLASLPRPAAMQLLPWVPVAEAHQIAYNILPQQVVPLDLDSAKVLRAVYTTRQLQDVLTDFWFNHFNVYIAKGLDRNYITAYERDAIRPHVLGKFSDLLLATAESPAMLYFLDNWQSVDPHAVARQVARQDAVRARRGLPPLPAAAAQRGLNENYGREIMELHTVGLHYTQADVIAVARCFTGWTIRGPLQNPTFFYNDALHDKGAKVVLGVTIPAGGGMSDGLKVIQILASSPETAHHISFELAQRFVADDPPPALVDRMAAAYLKSGGDLRQVMETMIQSPEFWQRRYYRNKMKSPLEVVVSSVRALGAQVTNPWRLTQVIAGMGEPLYAKQPPNGYGNRGAAWITSGSLLDRFNFAMQLAHNQVPGVEVHLAPFDAGATTLAAAEPELERGLLHGQPSPALQAALARALPGAASAQPPRPPQAAMVAALLLGSPDFQRR